MNIQKVAVGGLGAGVVLFILDFISNTFVLASRFEADLNRINPDLAANLETTGSLVTFGILDLVMGVALVWLYAAIRPRFGAGPKTAIIAGVYFWIATGMIWAYVTVIGLFSWTAWMLGGVAWLVTCLGSAYVGGMLYKE